VDKFFQTLARLASSYKVLLAKSENSGSEVEKSVNGGKNLAMLASEFLFVLPKTEFHSHLASWQVDIRTPGLKEDCIMKKITGTLSQTNLDFVEFNQGHGMVS
jgi:hypothetical protein